MQRYFAINKNLEINKDDIYHITKVMRMKTGDMIGIVWDKKCYICEIKEINKSDVKYEQKEVIDEDNELSKKIIIAFSLVNEAKTDFIIQKCTELGTYEFIPIITERSKIKLNEKENKKIDRWQKIAKEAAEQSHRNIIPKINKVMTIKELSDLKYDAKIVCSTKKDKKNIKKYLKNMSDYDTIIIVVGPEGGITEKEEEFLNEIGYESITLGDRIMRTETAPIFAVSNINYELMR